MTGIGQWEDAANGIYYSLGNVGIGTSNPGALLEVAYQNGVGSSYFRANNNPASNSILLLRRSRGIPGSENTVLNGDFIGQIAFEGFDGTTFKRAARLTSQVDGTVGFGIVPGNLLFHTRDSFGAMNENMRITSSGNVGIGVTDPGAKLEVAGQIKITGGSPAAGKVLFSDANGLAAWYFPSFSEQYWQ